jgi:serine O-acetyltransferase
MDYSRYKYLIQSDLYRITGVKSWSSMIHELLFGESFKYIFWMRTCRYTRAHPLLKFSLHPIARFMLHHYTYSLGIWVPFTTEIGSGFYIGHFGCILVSPSCRIGKNCNLSQGVTIGDGVRDDHRGFPVIGDNVFVGPGAKIFGGIRVGDNVAIGANAVVLSDVPENAVVAGVPGRIVSYKGSEGFINRTDYDKPSPGSL